MRELPKWIQEIADEVADIAQNPRRMLKGNSLLATRTNTPKLIGLVERMAGVLEFVMPEYCFGGEAHDSEYCAECELRDGCDRYEALQVLDEYRGEVEGE